jgi:hypothetical protein
MAWRHPRLRDMCVRLVWQRVGWVMVFHVYARPFDYDNAHPARKLDPISFVEPIVPGACPLHNQVNARNCLGKNLAPLASLHPRPVNGILVAITVRVGPKQVLRGTGIK